MRRREFLSLAGGAALAGQMASVLVHEHVLVDFVGADQIRPGRYDRDEVFRIARPKLEELGRLGCRASGLVQVGLRPPSRNRRRANSDRRAVDLELIGHPRG